MGAMYENTDPESVDLVLVQHQLDVLARWRSASPLNSWEQERYRELCEFEQILLRPLLL